MIRVFVAGEGAHELGDWARDATYRASPPAAGAIEVLARKVSPEGWSVVGGVQWKRIRKVAPGAHRSREERNVRGALLQAQEANCEVVLFLRDQDGDGDREPTIEAAVADSSKVAWGVPVRSLDAWLLALEGREKTEQIREPKDEVGDHHAAVVIARFQAADISAAPRDARSLRAWLDRVRIALP